MGRPRVVFTDLDGTLLRHEDYDWRPARDALRALADRGVPLVIASSKTRAEIEAWRERLRLAGPFISENGGALFVPPGTTPRPPAGATREAGLDVVRFGAPYARLRAALRGIEGALGVPLRGFGDMDLEAIRGVTGLTREEAARSAAREHDEPFVPARPLAPGEEERLASLAAGHGLRVTRGGRFHHLMGAGSKGEAARALLAAWGPEGERPESLALGDGPNDLELLQAADHAAVVARPDGSHAPELRDALPRARFTEGAGPEGFREAVLAFLGT